MTDLEKVLEGDSDPLAVLVRADMLEEEGRWEEAACLRLHGLEPETCTQHDIPGRGYVYASRDGLHVGRWPFLSDGEWWLWRVDTGWQVLPLGGGRYRRDPLPADIRQLVEEAIRRLSQKVGC